MPSESVEDLGEAVGDRTDLIHRDGAADRGVELGCAGFECRLFSHACTDCVGDRKSSASAVGVPATTGLMDCVHESWGDETCSVLASS